MKFVALLRGINVGGNHKVEMNRLKTIFKSLGYLNVSTYINSGNILFESDKKTEIIKREVGNKLKKEFGFEIPTLIKSEDELSEVAKAIPKEWQNDASQKTDVAYLFHEIDDKKIIDELPIKKEFINIKYVSGALIWNVERKNYNKSHINKLISHKIYKSMTVRNVNTARYLARKERWFHENQTN